MDFEAMQHREQTALIAASFQATSPWRYSKFNFKNTGVFIGSSDPDPHVPVHRVNDTATQLEKMGAQVTKKIYPNMGHTINQDEIDEANRLIFRSKK